MANSNGSFPSCPRHNAERRLPWAFGLFLVSVLVANAEPLPGYLRAALARFAPEVPPGWAYKLTTIRDDVRMVEQFDPANPEGAQWTLLEWRGRPPTADELDKYARSRPSAATGGARSNFKRDDIEPGSLRLVREDAEWAEFSGSFREQSTGADKMLGHFHLRLVVNKIGAWIRKYQLELKEPYSPVLGVRMHELFVEGTYDAPAGDTPSLPSAQSSRFSGRILFIPKKETLVLIYSDFRRSPAKQSR